MPNAVITHRGTGDSITSALVNDGPKNTVFLVSGTIKSDKDSQFDLVDTGRLQGTNGMVVAVHGLLPGTANVTIVATWNDSGAGIGPFTITVSVTVGGSAATGLTVTFGNPIVRP